MEKLKQIYSEINSLSDEIPGQLAKKITLYGKALERIGKLHSQAVLDYGKAYAQRKNLWGTAILNAQGTAKDKEGIAEVESYQARLEEAQAESEKEKWRNLYTATQEIINALKIELKVLMKEYGGD